MRTTHSPDHELAVSMTSSAGLEMFWSTVAVGCALIGMVSSHALAMSAAATIAMSFAMLARSGELAARWPREDAAKPSREAIGFNVIAGLGALACGSLAIAGVQPFAFVMLGLLLLAGMLVLDAPLEHELAAPHGGIAGGLMVLGGLAAIVMVCAAFSARSGEPSLVPWAALFIAIAHLAGAGALLLRFGRNAMH
jgi:hypothetical protein